MDDIRPPRKYGATQPTNYGRTPTTQLSHTPETAPVEHEVNNFDTSYNLPDEKKSGKGTKIALVFFIIIALVASGFAAYEYMKVADLQSEVDVLNKENDRLNERIYSLNYDNKDASKKLELVTDENAALKEENTQLLEACGTACDNITP